MCPLSVALFERFTVCSAKMAEPIDGKASNRLRYTLSVCSRQVKNRTLATNTVGEFRLIFRIVFSDYYRPMYRSIGRYHKSVK